MQLQLQQSDSSSPSSLIGTSGENVNNNNRCEKINIMIGYH